MREKNTLTFLIGPCLSGKSHYCEKMKSEDCIIVSSDAKRLELGITTDDPSTHELVFTECKKIFVKRSKTEKMLYLMQQILIVDSDGEILLFIEIGFLM